MLAAALAAALAVPPAAPLVSPLASPLAPPPGGCSCCEPEEPPFLVRTIGADDRPEIGTAIFVGDEIEWNWRPEPALVTPVTNVERARFPAVDVHCHWTLDQDPAALLAAMDARNVRRAVNLSGGWGETLDAMLARFHAAAPDRLLIFCNLDFSRIDEPDFGNAMAAFVRDAHARGASGLKIFKNLGLTLRDASGALVPVDDPRLDPVWSACGELGLPVLVHSADPIAFFQPTDARNERWMQLKRHPDWSFHGPRFPSHAEIVAQFERMAAKHPGTTFVAAHVANLAEDLASARALLERLPNVVMDISGRVGELGRQPYAARRLFLDFPDRILYGTDRYPGRPDQPRERIYFRFLETDDEHFRPYDHPFAPSGDWRIFGIFLPDDVLERVYRTNAERVLGLGSDAAP